MTDPTHNDGGNGSNEQIKIVGPTTEHTTGPYGEQGCDETMHVVIDGEDVYVPWTGVRPSGYDFHGSVPDRFDVDRIVLYDGHIHADADVAGGSVEVIPDYNEATAEFRGYESWTLEFFQTEDDTDPEAVYDDIIHERNQEDEDQ